MTAPPLLDHDRAMHRRGMEDRALTGSITLAHRGQFLAFGIALVALLCATGLLLDDKSIGGLAAILTAVGVIAIAFLSGRSDDD